MNLRRKEVKELDPWKVLEFASKRPTVRDSTWRREGFVSTTKRALLLATAVTAALVWAAPSYAAESFRLLSINTTGCNSGNFGMSVVRDQLDGGAYNVRTVVTVNGLIYMNENASISTNGLSGWNLFNNFSYGAVPNPGTWPIPQNKQVRIDFTLERPLGTILYRWSAVAESCNAGNLLYSGITTDDNDRDFVPVPRDKCPNLRATTLNGCPARTLTIAYDGPRQRFIGWLVAKGFPSLYSHRVVTLWRVRPGPDQRIGRVRTTTRGNYALAFARRAGLYYAVTGAVGNVVTETSLRLRLN
jgi:hypothetical protein